MADFYEVMRDWMTRNDEPGFLAIWRSRCVSFPEVATEIMECFDRFLENPPADLIARYQDATEYVLNHVTETKITPYSFDDYVAYFRALRDRMRVIYDETKPLP